MRVGPGLGLVTLLRGRRVKVADALRYTRPFTPWLAPIYTRTPQARRKAEAKRLKDRENALIKARKLKKKKR